MRRGNVAWSFTIIGTSDSLSFNIIGVSNTKCNDKGDENFWISYLIMVKTNQRTEEERQGKQVLTIFLKKENKKKGPSRD